MHASLAELELAFKALDAYIDTVEKALARVDRSGSVEPGLDNYYDIISTASEGVKLLCTYGGEPGLEKALEVGRKIGKWIQAAARTAADGEEDLTGIRTVIKGSITSRKSPEKVLAEGYRAIGISLAFAAKSSIGASDWAKCMDQAAEHLRRSLSAEFADILNADSLFALGMVLAESEKLDEAMDIVKQALLPFAHILPPSAVGIFGLDPSHGSHTGSPLPHSRMVKRLLPLWHLLVLLLSAEQEYQLALTICESVIENYTDPIIRMGDGDPGFPNFSDGDEGYASSRPSYDQFTAPEGGGQALLQLKMTQLALVEVVEGAEATINASGELLALYSVIFGDFSDLITTSASLPSTTSRPPQTSSGTIRSIGGSLFGRSKGSKGLFRRPRINFSGQHTPRSTSSKPPDDAGPLTAGPRIVVTEEPKAPQNTFAERLYASSLDDRKSRLTKPSIVRAHSADRSNTDGTFDQEKADSQGEIFSRSSIRLMPRANGSHTIMGEIRESEVQSSESYHVTSDSPVSPSDIAVALTHDEVATATITPAHPPAETSSSPSDDEGEKILNGQDSQIANGDTSSHASWGLAQPAASLPAVSQEHDSLVPEPLLSRAQTRVLRLGLLVRCWLLISGLYRRAGLYEDAAGAVDEASRLVESYSSWQARVTDNEPSLSSTSASLSAWDIDELYGDVLVAVSWPLCFWI